MPHSTKTEQEEKAFVVTYLAVSSQRAIADA